MDEKLYDTPITGNYVARHMKESMGPHAILRSLEAEKFASGQGYWSRLLLMKFVWEPAKQDHLPVTAIAKVPTVESIQELLESKTEAEEGEKLKAMMTQVGIGMHNVECDLYNMFGPSPPVAMPKLYVALPWTDRAPGMIILEDLSEKAAVVPSFADGLSYPQILSAVTEIARLHAWSLTTSTDWSKMPTLEDSKQFMEGFIMPKAEGYKATKEKYPEYFGSIDVKKLTASTNYELFIAIMNEHREFMDDVLVHGDIHAMNMMYEKNKDGSVGDRLVALIDFQAVIKGSPAYDVGRLFYYSLSCDLRHKHYDDILRRYYDEVKSLAGDKFKANFDQLHRLVDRQFALGAISALSNVDLICSVIVKSEGEQKKEKVLNMLRSNYHDAAIILGL